MHAELTPISSRISHHHPSTATVHVRGDQSDHHRAVVQALTEMCLGVGGDSRTVGTAIGQLRLPGGAEIRLTAGPVAQPERHAAATFALTAVVEKSGSTEPSTITAALNAVQRCAFTDFEMAELRQQMPLTAGLARHLPANCLAGIAPVVAVHHMTDFVVMIEAIIALGVPPSAITVIDKDYRYQHTARVDAHLKAMGVTVAHWGHTSTALADHIARVKKRGLRSLFIDDGGYLLPTLLDEHPALVSEVIGLVEQTTSGIVKLERFGDQLPLPVFSVAQSRLKATIESYGIADAAVRNILALLPHEKFEGQPALVLGFGRIGEQVAEVLRSRRMRVAVYESAIVRLVAAHEQGFVTDRSLIRLLGSHKPMLIVGSTGKPSIRGEHATALKRDCYLVSTTSRTNEFALEELAEQARTISDGARLGMQLHLHQGVTATVVGDGLPINFHYAESLPNKYSDLVLASLLVGAAALTKPEHEFSPGHNVATTDRVLESCGLLERYYALYGGSAA